MDEVSGLADKSSDFASFFTVFRKFGYNWIYLFHIIYPEKSIWQMIISQTKIFNIFPGSIQLSNVLKIIMSNCHRETITCIPARNLWSKIYIAISNGNNKIFLIIDCRNINLIGPGKYRTNADNPEKQFCYFNEKKKEKRQHLEGKTERVNSKNHHGGKIAKARFLLW